MTDLRQAAQQALECIERLNAHGWILADFEDEVYAAITSLKAALEQPEQEPSQWRDMVVVSLVREGINKHKARELADHFAAQPEPPPEWEAINNILHEYGLQAIDFVAEWKAAQRPWQGLTDKEQRELHKEYEMDGWGLFYDAIEAALRSKNK
jgi:hypothetical protein